MIKLRRIHHVCLRVADVDEASRRWCVQFGLTERDKSRERALLRCGYEPYSVELIQARSPGFDHAAYELDRSVSLDDACRLLDEKGVPYARSGNTVHLADADGNGIELVAFEEPEERWPDIARATAVLPGFRPRKLGHVNYLTGNHAEQVAFYTDVLGMDVTDRLGTDGTWLHINADHHVMALVNKGYAHIHHFALEYVDWGELRVAFDHLAQHGRWLAWGPVRHGIGRNLSGYVRILEEECFVEVFSDIEQLERDHQPREWPDDNHSSNVWGILPPRSYFRFDETAIDSERDGLEALGIPLSPQQVGAKGEA